MQLQNNIYILPHKKRAIIIHRVIEKRHEFQECGPYHDLNFKLLPVRGIACLVCCFCPLYLFRILFVYTHRSNIPEELDLAISFKARDTQDTILLSKKKFKIQVQFNSGIFLSWGKMKHACHFT